MRDMLVAVQVSSMKTRRARISRLDSFPLHSAPIRWRKAFLKADAFVLEAA